MRGTVMTFCGTPFAIMGSVVLDCQFGRERHASEKRKRAASVEVNKIFTVAVDGYAQASDAGVCR